MWISVLAPFHELNLLAGPGDDGVTAASNVMKTFHFSFGIFTSKTLLIALVSSNTLWCGTLGILEGKARDKATREPLPTVNVLIVGTTYGATTDAQGNYRINNLRAGLYSVRFSILGYKTVVIEKVTVIPDVRTELNADLEQSAIELEPVIIRY